MMIVLAILAAWRLTSLLTEENGPADIFERIRERLNPGGVLDCFWCTSIWVAIPFAFMLEGNTIILWLGISGGAITLREGISGLQ